VVDDRFDMTDMKFPPGVEFQSDLHLFLWKPRGILNERAVNKIIDFIGAGGSIECE
jgi:hypothetical protein